MNRKNLTIGSIAFTIAMISLIPNTRSYAASATDDREAIRPYNINVPEEALTGLRQRIKATRWPDKETVSDQSQGVQLAQARAQLNSIETDLERLTVRAPVDGQVLQVKVHLGEFAPTGSLPIPLVLLGNVENLHVRVDVDEHEAWRVRPEAKAAAAVRGNANLRTPLTFVRYEPFVVPKKSLTGDSTERVDTRVLQVIYRIDDRNVPVFVGQQMDVFMRLIVSADPTSAACRWHYPSATEPSLFENETEPNKKKSLNRATVCVARKLKK